MLIKVPAMLPRECPLSDNWINFNRNLKTNLLVADRFSYDVLCHTDLQRNSRESLGIPLDRINWGNYELVVIDESHNFRNNDAFKDRETRYQTLMNRRAAPTAAGRVGHGGPVPRTVACVDPFVAACR